jgi:segregation and condensation protein B
MNLAQKIESYLFVSGSRMSISELAHVFSVSKNDIENALSELQELLFGHGIMLLRDGDICTLGTLSTSDEWFADIRKKELSTPLSKGAHETLAIILYQGSATKPEIDYIRGVNSQFMLRNLLIRGLIEKISDSTDKRITRYRPSIDTLKKLGITDINQLPNHDEYTNSINQLLDTSSQIDKEVVLDNTFDDENN